MSEAEKTGGIVYRPMTVLDWTAMLSLEREAHGGGGYSPYYMRMAPLLHGRSSFVAERGSEVVGYVLGAFEEAHSSDAWLLSVAVRRLLRGHGIGKELSRLCVESLIERGAWEVLLTVSPDNTAALRIYERLGFEEVRKDPAFYGAGEPRIILRRLAT